jgi:hypothetical protein
MAEDKREATRFDGPYMIQDRDHMSGIAQAGGDDGGGRQADQSHRGGRQQGGQDQGGGQLGGQRTRRSKLL